MASRIFPDNRLADTPIDGGLANRDTWRIWSYQAQGLATFESALNELGPVARVISHSVGYAFISNADSSRARAVDEAVYRYRSVFTQVAHNGGPASTSLRDPAGTYNGIVVGASGTTESAPDVNLFRGFAENGYVAYYSSRGPTTDGRSGPDLIAPGTKLRLAHYDPESPSATASQLISGTSFAAPYVASLATRLIDEGSIRNWNTDPLVIKSVMQNSAQEIRLELSKDDGMFEEQWDGWAPDRTTKPLDDDQGAGEISTDRAMRQYLTNPEQNPGDAVARIGWDFDNELAPDGVHWYQFNLPVHQGAPLTATLNWFREFDEDGNRFPLDDLNLELWKTDGIESTELVTISNSSLDNTEHIHRFSIPEPGFYALGVHFDSDYSLNGTDQYALAWLLPESPFLPGDSNLDGDVDLEDFSALKAHFGAGRLLSEGDFDLDRDVDIVDFEILKGTFGAKTAAPEPAAWLLAISGLPVLGGIAGKRRKPIPAAPWRMSNSTSRLDGNFPNDSSAALVPAELGEAAPRDIDE